MQNVEPIYEIGTGQLVGYKIFVPVGNEENDRLNALSAFDRIVTAFCYDLSRQGWDTEIDQIRSELKKPRKAIPKYKVVEDTP